MTSSLACVRKACGRLAFTVPLALPFPSQGETAATFEVHSCLDDVNHNGTKGDLLRIKAVDKPWFLPRSDACVSVVRHNVK